MHRIHPAPSSDITIAEAYAAPLGSRPDRPWCGLCMVSSIDGSIAVDGRSGGLSNAHDKAVLAQLRSVADVVLVGAGTVRDEGYGPPIKPGQRVGVVTASGNVDTTSDLFTSGAGFVVTTETAPAPATVDVLRAGRAAVDFELVLRRLQDVCGPTTFVQAEGGARLNGALLDSGVLDELNVTTSARAVGGNGPRLAVGADERSRVYRIAQLVIDDDAFVFSRWVAADAD